MCLFAGKNCAYREDAITGHFVPNGSFPVDLKLQAVNGSGILFCFHLRLDFFWGLFYVARVILMVYLLFTMNSLYCVGLNMWFDPSQSFSWCFGSTAWSLVVSNEALFRSVIVKKVKSKCKALDLLVCLPSNPQHVIMRFGS